MSSYKKYFRKLAEYADKMTIEGAPEIAHEKRIYGLKNFLNDLNRFTERYAQTARAVKNIENQNGDVASRNLSDFHKGFFINLNIFAYMTHCNEKDVVAALGVDYDDLFADHILDAHIVDDTTQIDILRDVAEETQAYIRTLETGRRTTHTPISRYLAEKSMQSPYPPEYSAP